MICDFNTLCVFKSMSEVIQSDSCRSQDLGRQHRRHLWIRHRGAETCRDMPRKKWKNMGVSGVSQEFQGVLGNMVCMILIDFVCCLLWLLWLLWFYVGVRGFIVAFVFCAGVSGDYFLLTKTLLMFVFLGFAQGDILRGLGFPTLPCASSCPWSVLSGCPVWNAQRSALPSTRVWKCQQWTLDDSFSRFKRCYCTIKSLWLSFTFASTASKHHVDSKKRSHAIFILWLKKVEAHLKHSQLKVMSQYVSIISMSRPAFFAEAACGPTLPWTNSR